MQKKITVYIEGPILGSGVLVKKERNVYTVLTSWHVVKDYYPGDEVEIVTFDGKRHTWDNDSIERVGEVDMAVLNFKSIKDYQVAKIGTIENVTAGQEIFVSGFRRANL